MEEEGTAEGNFSHKGSKGTIKRVKTLSSASTRKSRKRKTGDVNILVLISVCRNRLIQMEAGDVNQFNTAMWKTRRGF